MSRYTIAPGEVLDFAFDFNGPSPGPALRAGQSLAAQTVTAQGGLTVISQAIEGATVVARISCPESVPTGTRASLRCSVTTAGASSGEVLVDQIDITVAL